MLRAWLGPARRCLPVSPQPQPSAFGTHLLQSEPCGPRQLHHLLQRGQAVQQAAHRVAAAQGVASHPRRIRRGGSRGSQAPVVQRVGRRARQAGQPRQAGGAQHLRGGR